jgi:hypothetical protein
VSDPTTQRLTKAGHDVLEVAAYGSDFDWWDECGHCGGCGSHDCHPDQPCIDAGPWGHCTLCPDRGAASPVTAETNNTEEAK